jgi:O-antigen biosynthesis protein
MATYPTSATFIEQIEEEEHVKLLNRLRKAIVLYRFINKQRMRNTVREVRRQYGFSGLIVAILNKLNDRPLLSGLLSTEQDATNTYYSPDTTDYDLVGERIFQRQQAELSVEEIRDIINKMQEKPLISVIMPIYNPPLKWLARAVASLQAQHYPKWELCAVDDGSEDGRGGSFLRNMAQTDPRIRFIRSAENTGISAASNSCLEMCTGVYTALLDQDDELTPDALFWIAKSINEHKDVDFIYTDECKITGTSRNSFFFKPDWSPLMMVNHMYIGHLTVYRTDLIKRVGGFRSKFDFSQDYDLALRVGDVAKTVIHVERVLYFWRTLPSSGSAGGKDYARVSNIEALGDWYRRRGLSVVMEKRERANYGRLKRDSDVKVSIVIPTDSYENLKMSIQGLLTQTSYSNIEIVPVTNSRLAEQIEREYSYLDSLCVCHYNKVYNFSDKCNEGARKSSGDVIIFYNDDVVPFSRDWVERQVELLKYPNVGGVSPLLVHEDRTIQYAGMITGTPGLVGTAFNGRNYTQPATNAFNHQLVRDVSVLSGAVMTIPREVFFEVGGFDAENTPNRHSDVDLSFKLQENGYRCVYTPYSILTHVGRHSWAEKERADKADIYCLKRWGTYLAGDMYFSDSMKEMFYRDFGYNYRIYCDKNLYIPGQRHGKDILFVSHELTRTGAPVVLKDMVQASLNDGDFPVVISPVDGPLRQEYLSMGVAVIIDESFVHGHWMFEHFARNFDLVVVNTLACGNAIALLENSLPPVMWWIHEGSFAINHFRSTLPSRLGKKVTVYCVGQYALDKFNELGIRCQPMVLGYGVEDHQKAWGQLVTHPRVTFLLVGTYEIRKGQDIFVRAIRILEHKYKGKAEYIFVGNVLDGRIYAEVEQLATTNRDVTMMSSLSRDAIFDLYSRVTCVVSPSRDDPMPVVLAEAMMLSRICICSTNTGTASYIKDGYNGYVFQSEDAEELAEKMAFVIDNADRLDTMKMESRKIYEEYYAMDMFFQNFTKIKSELVDGSTGTFAVNSEVGLLLS